MNATRDRNQRRVDDSRHYAVLLPRKLKLSFEIRIHEISIPEITPPLEKM